MSGIDEFIKRALENAPPLDDEKRAYITQAFTAHIGEDTTLRSAS